MPTIFSKRHPSSGRQRNLLSPIRQVAWGLALLLCAPAAWAGSITNPHQAYEALDQGSPRVRIAPDAATLQALQDYLSRQFQKKPLAAETGAHLIGRREGGGGDVVWAFRSKKPRTVKVVAERGRSWPMIRLNDSDWWVAAERFPDFSSCHYRFEVDGQRQTQSQRFGFETYPPNHPDSKVQAGVPQGELTDMGTHVSKIHFPGAQRQWWIYVPAQYKQHPEKPASLIVFNDGGGFCKGDGNACIVLDNLIHKQKLPVTIALFVNPGSFPAAKGTPGRSNRSDEYDTCTPRFATFLDEEILNIVREKYNISTDPWDHAICGSSSGASCAFTAAWHRNDLFRRVISFVGSYCDFRPVDAYPVYQEQGFRVESNRFSQWKTAHDYPGLIRKTNPRREIRVVLQDGKNDLDNTLGNWFLNNERMAAALSYAGYPYQFIIGEGMHSSQHGKSVLPDVLTWAFAH